jgi:Trypsin-co-occurring domain 1
MAKIIELESGKSTILVESSEVAFGDTQVQARGVDLEKNFDRMLERIQPFCESVINNFEKLKRKPNSASAEFGLSISGEGNLFVVKASGQATIKVTLNWSLNNEDTDS